MTSQKRNLLLPATATLATATAALATATAALTACTTTGTTTTSGCRKLCGIRTFVA